MHIQSLTSIRDLRKNAGTLSAVEILVQKKHDEYSRGARLHCTLYYSLRVIAGLCAGLLPFVVASNPSLATGLSIAIVVATTFDLIFNPKDKWQLYSRATDFLTVEQIKREGHYAEYEGMIQILVNTESAKLERLMGMDEMLQKIRKPDAGKPPAK
jgi:Protein of unknown function (DUF4231)